MRSTFLLLNLNKLSLNLFSILNNHIKIQNFKREKKTSKPLDVVISGSVQAIKGNLILSPPTNDNHTIDIVPELRIDGLRFDFEDKTLLLSFNANDGASKNESSPGIRNQIKDIVKNSFGVRTDLLRKHLKNLHEQIANMFQKTGYFNKFDGSFRLSKFNLFDSYIEIGFRLRFNENEAIPFIPKTGRYADKHVPNQEGVELIVTENFINSVLYILYDLNVEFSWRSLLSNFPSIIEEHMRAGRLAIVWEDIGNSYGYEKPLDFKCTFGKSLPIEIGESYPGVVKFNKSNAFDINFTMLCKVLIQKDFKEWEVFKTLFVDLNIEAFIDLTPTPKGSKIASKTFIRRSILKKFAIMKEDSFKKDSETNKENMSKMINMNMAKIKYFLSMEIYDKTFNLPNLNKCKSVALYNPKVSMYDEFAVLSTNFRFKQSGMFCPSENTSKDEEGVVNDDQNDIYIKEDL